MPKSASATPATKTVEVKSPWTSKINWTQFIAAGLTFSVGVLGALHLDAATTAKATAGVAIAGQVATFVLKTFFTNSIASTSL